MKDLNEDAIVNYIKHYQGAAISTKPFPDCTVRELVRYQRLMTDGPASYAFDQDDELIRIELSIESREIPKP